LISIPSLDNNSIFSLSLNVGNLSFRFSALYFKTDAKDLFDWSLEQLVAEGWRIERLSFDLHESNLNENYKVMTTYEKRFTNEGLKINFVKATPPKK